MKARTLFTMVVDVDEDYSQTYTTEITQFTSNPIWNVKIWEGVNLFEFRSVKDRKNPMLLQTGLDQIFRSKWLTFFLFDEKNIARDLLTLQVSKKRLRTAYLSVVLGDSKIRPYTTLAELHITSQLVFSDSLVQVFNLFEDGFYVSLFDGSVSQVFSRDG